MNTAIFTYWLFNLAWTSLLTALVYFVGWWTLPILIMAGVTASCLMLKSVLGEA
ncbi:MAG: hypothetical protein HOH43_01055 [Candidatus Latescibacteria bacterium]|jgi:hypothetical protein|nr:hypothetical protein [Candidatus Latescibacterota bacterium]